MANDAPESSGSTWDDAGVKFPDLKPLRQDTEADVCVVGAGIAGLTTAYLLAEAGRKVVVLEADQCGGGETGRTTAHLASALDDRFNVLEKYHGEEGAKLAAESHAAAIDRIEAIAKQEGIDCDLLRLDGYLFVAPGQSWNLLDEEMEAAKRAGLQVERVERAPLPAYDTGPALRFTNQGQFHPVKYLAGLAHAVVRRGGRIFVKSPVAEFGDDENPRAVTKDGKAVRAKAMVVATNTPVNDRVKIHTKQAPYRTYAVSFLVPRGAIPAALYWDTADPYHYVRLQPKSDEHDVLIVGGQDHKTGQGGDDERENFAKLEAWAGERFPRAGEVENRWSGQVLEPVDYLAFLGRNPGDQNVYVATGDSGHGMTHGTIAGMLITDLILGRDNPWAKLYDPSRKSLRATGTFLSENVNVAKQYLDWVTGGDVSSATEIKAGEGAIVRKGLTKIAVYRDENNRRHTLSAVCTHLGCIVEWNSAERTWDCPCHGSRFGVDGKVLNGPAVKGLEPVEQEQPQEK